MEMVKKNAEEIWIMTKMITIEGSSGHSFCYGHQKSVVTHLKI